MAEGKSADIKRFKLNDGREGTQANLGNGLVKFLFDDGDCVIIVADKEDEDGSAASG